MGHHPARLTHGLARSDTLEPMALTSLTESPAPAATPVPRPGPRRPVRSRGRLAGEAVIAVVIASAVLAGCVQLFVHGRAGQRLDQAAMWAVSGPAGTLRHLHAVLGTISVATVAVALAGCELLALLRRRWSVALAVMVLVAGANATTQILKHEVLTRTDFGLGTHNTLPSGHTTVMVSLALAAILVAPRALRAVVTLLGAAAATLVGVGTVVARWHRPGDVVAAVAVCVIWAALALLLVAATSRCSGVRPSPGGGAVAWALLGAVTIGVVLVAAGLRPAPGLPASLGLAAASLAAIGVACAAAVGWAATMAARSLP